MTRQRSLNNSSDDHSSSREFGTLYEAREVLEGLHSDADGRELTAAEQDRWDAATAFVEAAEQRAEDLKALAMRGCVEAGSDQGRRAPQYMKRAADPWAPAGRETAAETRSRALTAVERWEADDTLKQGATSTLERLDKHAMQGVADHLIRFSDPLYVAAFRKHVADPETFAGDLTSEERRAWADNRLHARTALGTSGAVLPSPLDPTIVLTNSGAVDPMRSVARIVTTTAKSHRFITSAGSSFSFDAELAEVSDDTFAEAEVPVANHKGQGFVQASLEVWADQPGFDSEVAKIIADGKARLEAAKWITGSGTDEPKGIETALNATGAEMNAAGEDLTPGDVYALLHALPPRFRPNAKWQLELSTISKLHRLYNPTGTEPALIEGDMLLRRPFVENSNVDPYSAINAAATASNRVLFLGDWSNYVIVDRVGMSVSFLGPGILQNTANNRPDGRVGWYAYWRTGGDILSANAFKMLDVQTAA
ncbi:phage major capsid protein [Streptomyces sp. NPDC055085]